MLGTERHTDREEDYRFLHSMLMEKKLHLLFKIHERLRRFQKRGLLPAREHAAGLASDLAEELTHQSWSDEARELAALISKPHFKGLLSVHDAVARRDFEPTLAPVPDHAPEEEEEEEDSVKIVSLVKTKEPLGATIKRDKCTGAIVVARIMRGGPADKSGLIHEGDELREVNGVSLEHRKPKEIPSLLARSQKEVRFTIIPAFSKEEMPPSEPKLFVRALFDYDPGEDPAVPCKDAAVAFRRGDILQIVSAEDEAWWQACPQRDGHSRAGLVPSAQLHQRRVALQRPKGLFQPGGAKAPDEKEACPVVEDVDYGAITGIHIAGLRRSFRLGKKSSWVRRAAPSQRWSTGVNGSNPPPAYREVIPYGRDPEEGQRLVVLVGPDGVGVNELKRRLLISDPDRYGVTVPYTSREKREQESDGVDYHFLSVHVFEESILNNRFVEYGRYGGHYYGTSLDSVRKVMAEGKVCLLDVHPSKIKRVYSLEFMPYVVFVKPPRLEELRLTRRRAKFIGDGADPSTARIFSEEDFENMIDLAETMENQCGHLFDKVIVNGDAAAAFRELKADLQRVERAQVQWIPPEWVCPSPASARRSCGQLGGWI